MRHEQQSNQIGQENKYGYNGKELNDDFNLNLHDYGARWYDASIGRWHSVDPLAEKYYEWNPYHYVRSNPIKRFDPNGLTDYTFNSNTGELKQVGEANDEQDRILKTTRKGKIKYKKRNGKPRVKIKDIAKGILKDGMNFKEQNNIFEVGGEGKPTVEELDVFILQLSDLIGKELGGGYFSKDGAKGTTHLTLGRYKTNRFNFTGGKGLNLSTYTELNIKNKEDYDRYKIIGIYHTHPSRNVKDSDRLVPSDTDLDRMDETLRNRPDMRYFIITAPISNNGVYPHKFEYTTGYSRRL